MDFNLRGKKAFISGSTSGIGLETARILLNEGMNVYINGRSEKTVKKAVEYLKKEIKGSEVKGIVADFLKQVQVKNLLYSLKDVDVLINNVGIYTSTSFVDTLEKTWYDQFQVNVMSGVTLTKHFLGGMIARNWGRVIFISSECVYLAPTDLISYSSTKAALHSLSRGIAQLTEGSNVTSNVVVPGSTLSDGAKNFLEIKSKLENVTKNQVEKNFFNDERKTSLIKRFASTNEVATTIAYLCSHHSSASNGGVIRVDGGSSLGTF